MRFKMTTHYECESYSKPISNESSWNSEIDCEKQVKIRSKLAQISRVISECFSMFDFTLQAITGNLNIQLEVNHE